ncbi:MAG: Nramp family divalent metal transporter [Planctomycetales bacterium]|nr:Nramp family divalent metal transporter [Planctomycetales bacterium]
MVESADASTSATDEVRTIESPPRGTWDTLRRLGPGIIIAASIVGSGELIATTKTGAEAGFTLLWLIVLGCLIKVFVQIEFGRYTIAQGLTAMDGMNSVPGPRVGVNWLMWYWLVMFTLGLGQLGGIVGGVGQSMALTVPITGDYRESVRQSAAVRAVEAEPDVMVAEAVAEAEAGDQQAGTHGDSAKREPAAANGVKHEVASRTVDDTVWTSVITLVTIGLLVGGRYRMIQSVAAVLVASFTAVTIFNIVALQTYESWAIGWSDLVHGLSFRLPAAIGESRPVATALATFGIIGVGASELIAYPYWCLEKGYARFTGPRSDDEAWAARARGWMRVMRWDCWMSMAIYTFATVAFYLLGAAVLFRQGLNPDKSEMIPVLAEMFGPVFGDWANVLFLFGAVAVLYSTFFIATAANTRMAADAMRVFGVLDASASAQGRWIRIFCVAFPLVSLLLYLWLPNPVTLVLISGLSQTIMLPMLGGAALFFRYRCCDRRITPSFAWDAMLALSVLGLFVLGIWGAITGIPVAIERVGEMLLPG